MKKILKKVSLFLGLAMLLTACGPASSEGKSADTSKFPEVIENEGDAIDGSTQTLKVASISDSPFKGILHPFLYSDNNDWMLMQNTMAGAFPIDDELKLITNDKTTPINLSFDEKAKTATLEINPDFKWSNGDTVTTDDIIKTYEITANQDFIVSSKATRFDSDMKNIEGIEEYNQKKADKISGLERVSDSKLIIHFKEFTPSILWGGGIISEFSNAKQVEGIPMNKLFESDVIRKKPLSYGPYQITKVVPGESVTYVANEHYIYGAPKVKNLEIKVLPVSQTVASVKAGDFDIYLNTGADVYNDLKDLTNIKLAGRQDLYMSYMGFKLGKWDSAANKVVVDPNAKMADVNLRQAMGYAIDKDAIGEKFYYGLRGRATGPVIPLYGKLHDESIKGYEYDLDKAKKLLDDAGYKDTDNDGLRENPKGEKLTINVASMSGTELAEPLAQYYLQQFKEIGLDAKLVDGRLLDINNFYDRIEADDPGIDVFFAAFGMASNPDPSGLYGADAAFNLQRYTSDNLESALKKIASNESLDDKVRLEAYHNFEKALNDEAPMIPMLFSYIYLPVNNRVKQYNFSLSDDGSHWGWNNIELTAEKPLPFEAK